MHRPTEFAKRFADRLAERHYTDEELLPRNESDADARRVREVPPPYGVPEDDGAQAEDAAV
ncbi:MAG TPA: hypothetical protein VGD42_00305 [Lysobacter sp.]